MNKPTYNWQDLSEVCFGLIVKKRVDVSKFYPSMFREPYDSGLEEWKKSANLTRVSAIITQGCLDTAIQAAETYSDELNVEWNMLLLQASRFYAVGVEAQKLSKRLLNGEEVESERLIAHAQSMRELGNPTSIGLKSIDQVSDNFKPMIETGWIALDRYLGGIPQTRPTAVGGNTGEGKTIFTMHLIHHFIRRWKEKKVAVYTLELSDTAWKHRYLKLFPEDVDKFGQIYISDSTASVIEVGLECASINAGLFVIDYMDYLIRGEINEGAYRKTNLQLNEITRTMEIPGIVLHQYNNLRSTTKIPALNHFAWGTTNSNVAGLVLGIAKIADAEDAENAFAYDEDYPWSIFALKNGEEWLSKYPGPGVICLPKDRKLWASGEDSIWRKLEKQKKTKKIRED